MKNQLILILAILFSIGTAFAKVPQKFNYQGVARNASGQPLASQVISLQLSILTGSAVGAAEYVETHSATTNPYGLYNVTIGSGTVVAGSLAGVTGVQPINF